MMTSPHISSPITTQSFLSAIGLRNPHTQSLFNSSGYRRRLVCKRSKSLLTAEQDWIVDGGNVVRLQGHYSPGGSWGQSLKTTGSMPAAG